MSIDYDIDLIDKVVDEVEKVVEREGFGGSVGVGILGEENSISVFFLVGGEEEHYMDGTVDKVFNIQIDVKSDKQLESYNLSNKIISYIPTRELESEKYVFMGTKVTGTPTLIALDERGYYIYSVTLGINILL